MVRCKVTSCFATRVQYFKLPDEIKLRKKWIRAIGKQLEWEREKPKNPANWFVCSLHFSEDSFVPHERNLLPSGMPSKRRVLMPTAVPTMGLGKSEPVKKERKTQRSLEAARGLGE